jgi:hypothetical protein
MPQPLSEALCIHLERARDREGGSRTVWYTDYWHWECPTQEWWWRESKKSNTVSIPSPPECTKMAQKQPVSRTY